MDIDLPVHGLEPLAPLGAYLVIYLVFLMFVWLFLRPTLKAILARRTLPKMLGVLTMVAKRLLVFGLLLLLFLWALAELELLAGFYEWLGDLGTFALDIPYVGVLAIPILLIILVVLAYTVVRPAFMRARAPRR